MDKTATIKTIFSAGIMVFLFVWLVRIIFINHYGVDLPVWDQWGAEINGLYLPYLKGILTLKVLFLPHNEHRIFFTRVFNLIIFILNGNYSPVLAMKLQAGIMALIAALLASWNVIDDKKINYYSIAVIALFFGLPIGLANALCSFQNQFYFMILFSMVTIRLVTVDSISFSRFFWIVLFSVFSFLNVASGFFAPLVAGFVLMYLAVKKEHKTRYAIMGGSLTLLAIAMFKLTPAIPPEEAYMMAHSVGAFFKGLINTIIWPYGFGIIWWGVFLIFVLKNIILKRNDLTKYLFPLALYVWLLFQFVAIAYARNSINARYFDIPIIGIMAMVFLLDRWLNGKKAANFIKMFIVIAFMLALAFFNDKAMRDVKHDQQKNLRGVSTLRETMQLMKQNEFSLARKKIQNCSDLFPNCSEYLWSLLQNKDVVDKIIPSSIRQSVEKK